MLDHDPPCRRTTPTRSPEESLVCFRDNIILGMTGCCYSGSCLVKTKLGALVSASETRLKFWDVSKICDKVSRPYLQFFPRYEQLKSVRTRPDRFISSPICDYSRSFSAFHACASINFNLLLDWQKCLPFRLIKNRNEIKLTVVFCSRKSINQKLLLADNSLKYSKILNYIVCNISIIYQVICRIIEGRRILSKRETNNAILCHLTLSLSIQSVSR